MEKILTFLKCAPMNSMKFDEKFIEKYFKVIKLLSRIYFLAKMKGEHH